MSECKCDRNEEAEEEHTCPYQVEINDDRDFVCTCCPECTQGCADDV